MAPHQLEHRQLSIFHRADRHWEPRWSAGQRDAAFAGWQKAVERSLDGGDLNEPSGAASP